MVPTTCSKPLSKASNPSERRATQVGADTMLSKIVQMVAEAQRSRAPIQRLADQVAAWFVPAVVVIATWSHMR